MINAAEQIAKRVRAAMGDHNNDDLPVTQCVINMRKEVVSLQAERDALLEALVAILEHDSPINIVDTATATERDIFDIAQAALAAHRKQGGEV